MRCLSTPNSSHSSLAKHTHLLHHLTLMTYRDFRRGWRPETCILGKKDTVSPCGRGLWGSSDLGTVNGQLAGVGDRLSEELFSHRLEIMWGLRDAVTNSSDAICIGFSWGPEWVSLWIVSLWLGFLTEHCWILSCLFHCLCKCIQMC